VGVFVDYVSLAKKYIGRENNEILLANWPLQEYDLYHPLVVDRDSLLSLLPERVDVPTILEQTKLTQKELVRTIDITKLPVDRPSGYIGQIALFKVLQTYDFDFSYVVERTEYEWDKSGFSLIYLLLRHYFVNKEVGCGDIDLISGLLEPREGYQQQIRHGQNWYDRVMRTLGVKSDKLDYMQHTHLRNILERLHRVHQWRKVSNQKIQEWCGCSRSEANHLQKLLIGIELRKYYHLIPQNLGIVHSFTIGKKAPSSNTTSFIRCSNVENGENEYVNLFHDFPDRVETPHLVTNIFSLNTSLYNEKEGKWTLKTNLCEIKNLHEHSRLHFFPDFHSDSNHLVTQRDVFLAAFHLTMTSYAIDIMPCSLEQYIGHYTGIDIDDVSKGLKGLRRKNLLLPVYELGMILPAKTYFLIIAEDSCDKIIPYLGSIADSAPSCHFRTSDVFDALHAIVIVPKFLENEFRSIEYDLRETIGLNRQMYTITHYQLYNSSALMSLIPDYVQ
jgi:hypothetical protein